MRQEHGRFPFQVLPGPQCHRNDRIHRHLGPQAFSRAVLPPHRPGPNRPAWPVSCRTPPPASNQFPCVRNLRCTSQNWCPVPSVVQFCMFNCTVIPRTLVAGARHWLIEISSRPLPVAASPAIGHGTNHQRATAYQCGSSRIARLTKLSGKHGQCENSGTGSSLGARHVCPPRRQPPEKLKLESLTYLS